VLGVVAPLLHVAGVDSTCTTPTGVQVNCVVSVPGQVKGVFFTFLAIGLLVFAFAVICQVKIITKAGYSGWYVLTQFVPILGFVMFLMFAFGKWPIQERLEAAERGVGRGYPPPGGGGGGLGGGPGPGPGPGPSPYPGNAQLAGVPGGSVTQQQSSSGPGPGPGPAPSQGGPGPRAAAGAAPVAVVPQAGGDSPAIFCSWCGKERPVNAQAIHYCGSMERPSVYCMHCGTPLDGADSCAQCSTPATKISR
jgi:hypothetical protein